MSHLEGFTDVSDILACGVYALLSRGVVIYIGQSKRMISRIDNHRKVWGEKRRGKTSWLLDTLNIPGVQFDEVHICRCRPDQVDELERTLIAKYQPRFNIHHRKRGVLPKAIMIRGVEISLVPQPKPQLEFVRRV